MLGFPPPGACRLAPNRDWLFSLLAGNSSELLRLSAPWPCCSAAVLVEGNALVAAGKA